MNSQQDKQLQKEEYDNMMAWKDLLKYKVECDKIVQRAQKEEENMKVAYSKATNEMEKLRSSFKSYRRQTVSLRSELNVMTAAEERVRKVLYKAVDKLKKAQDINIHSNLD